MSYKMMTRGSAWIVGIPTKMLSSKIICPWKHLHCQLRAECWGMWTAVRTSESASPFVPLVYFSDRFRHPENLQLGYSEPRGLVRLAGILFATAGSDYSVCSWRSSATTICFLIQLFFFLDVLHSFICNNQKLEKTQMSINRRWDKLLCIYIAKHHLAIKVKNYWFIQQHGWFSQAKEYIQYDTTDGCTGGCVPQVWKCLH